MTKELLQKNGAQLLFADAADFPNSGAGPPTTAANDLRITALSPTAVQIDLTGVGAAAARQSTKITDLGAAWAAGWILAACIEHEAAPIAGGAVNFWWAASPNATAATGNPGSVVGADGAFTVGGTVQLEFIGSLIVLNQVVNIKTKVGFLRPSYRYGSLIVVNNTSSAFRSTAVAMDETHITLTSLIDELQ